MQFGVTTMVFYSRPLDEAIQAIARCGYDFAELWMDQVWRDFPSRPAEGVRRVLEKSGIGATVHCPVMDVNITSPNIGIRNESIRQLLDCIEFAHEIGARLVVVHPGRRFSVKEPFTEHWKAQVEALGRAFDKGASLGVTLALENMEIDKGVASVTDYPDMLRVVKDCGVEDLKITLDTAHMRDTKVVLRFIENLGPRIAHVHVSDATDKALHLRIGEGTLDLPAIARSLEEHRFSGIYSLETYIPGDEDALADEKRKLARLFD
ncbi:MAG: sugar phosphate isomerase/epimerase family protein [Clostridia bacterium]|nr:sugar phosphate isomerase/epimerase family protein [Clostridia bacterium]